VGLETCHLLVPRMAVAGIGESACLPIVIDWNLWFPEINASINIPGSYACPGNSQCNVPCDLRKNIFVRVACLNTVCAVDLRQSIVLSRYIVTLMKPWLRPRYLKCHKLALLGFQASYSDVFVLEGTIAILIQALGHN